MERIKLNKLWFVVGILGAIAPSTLAQNIPVPRPDRNGDYQRANNHTNWVVVDRDPNGVNCRWSSQMPEEWYSPDARFPTMNVQQWPTVRRFRNNTRLTANTEPAGLVVLNDDRNLPWLKVSIGDNERICLVRANFRFVQPVRR